MLPLIFKSAFPGQSFNQWTAVYQSVNQWASHLCSPITLCPLLAFKNLTLLYLILLIPSPILTLPQHTQHNIRPLTHNASQPSLGTQVPSMGQPSPSPFGKAEVSSSKSSPESHIKGYNRSVIVFFFFTNPRVNEFVDFWSRNTRLNKPLFRRSAHPLVCPSVHFKTV